VFGFLVVFWKAWCKKPKLERHVVYCVRVPLRERKGGGVWGGGGVFFVGGGGGGGDGAERRREGSSGGGQGWGLRRGGKKKKCLGEKTAGGNERRHEILSLSEGQGPAARVARLPTQRNPRDKMHKVSIPGKRSAHGSFWLGSARCGNRVEKGSCTGGKLIPREEYINVMVNQKPKVGVCRTGGIHLKTGLFYAGGKSFDERTANSIGTR